MSSKKQILLESIRKLFALHVSKEEIVTNLADVGVSKPEALMLIKEAKRTAGKKPAPVKPGEKKEKSRRFERFFRAREKKRSEAVAKPRIAKKSEAMTEELAEEFVEPEKEEAAKTEEMLGEISYSGEEVERGEKGKREIGEREKKLPTAAKREEKLPTAAKSEGEKEPAAVERGKEKPKAVPEEKSEKKIETLDLSKLWEKGILTAVNNRLREMKELRQDIDAVLDKKVQAATKRELDKIRVLFDSQRTLLVSKVDSEIESKAKAFVGMIEAKLREMRETSREIENSIESLRNEKQRRKVQEEALAAKLQEVGKTQQQLVVQMNAALIKEKSNVQQLLDEAEKKLKDIDERVNKTLQLESEIVEGLARDVAAKIEKGLEGKKAGLDKETIAQLQGFQTSKAALEQQIRERLVSLDKLQEAVKKEFKPEQFNQQMQQLQQFKQQFIKAIQYNVKKFNAAIKKMNETAASSEQQIILRTKKIDEKIAELDAFERNFAKEMGIALERLTEKKKP